MAIETINHLVKALGNNSSRIILDKASSSISANNFASLWRMTGQPGQGAIPTTAVTCNHTTVGSIIFTQQTAPVSSYGAYLEIMTSNATTSLEIHDRLVHMGGLSGTVTTAQTVGIDLNTFLATDNIDIRKGDADFSDIIWWLEWYTGTGATVVNATVNVTYNDGTTGNLNSISLASGRPVSNTIPINSFIPAAASGKYIRGVNNVTLSATTGTAGNFGITATRPRMSLSSPIANFKQIVDWAQLGLPEIYNSSSLFPIIYSTTATSGTIRGNGKIVHG